MQECAPVKSWSTNCPHCISIWVTDSRGTSLSSWIVVVTCLALGSGLPVTDFLGLWIPSSYTGSKNLTNIPQTHQPTFSESRLNDRAKSFHLANHLCIGDMAEPHHRFRKLLQLPSEVLYLKLAAGQAGTPLFGQLRWSGLLWLRRDRSESVGIFGNLGQTGPRNFEIK